MRVSGTPVPISGWNMIPTCYGCMFLGDDDLMCKGYDSVWATGMSAVILTPSAEVRNPLHRGSVTLTTRIERDELGLRLDACRIVQ